MSWETEHGDHGGYVRAEFADGTRASGMSGGGVPADQVIVAVDYVGDPSQGIPEVKTTTRAAGEVIGWRVMCDCREGSSSVVTGTWVSDLIVRVPSKTLEDPAAGKIYAPDQDVVDVDETHYEALHQMWRRQHVDELEGLAGIREARRRELQAQEDLDVRVAAARAAGASWEAIGRAAGVRRQSAHQRWGGA